MQVTYPVIDRMQERIDRWERSNDQRSVFLRCYALMTRNMLDALHTDEFSDPAWVSRLLEHFASYYFDALDAYEAGAEHIPEVWRSAHDAAHRSNTPAISLLLLGVNAHINYDLVLAVADILEPEWQALSEGDRRAALRRLLSCQRHHRADDRQRSGRHPREARTDHGRGGHAFWPCGRMAGLPRDQPLA